MGRLKIAHAPALAGIALSGALLVLPQAATPQAQDGPGGTRLVFGLEQRFEADSNPDLAVAGSPRRTEARTRLSLGATSETRSTRLAFDAGFSLRALGGSGVTGKRFSIADPQLGLAYSRESADARLEMRARLREDDVSFLRGFGDFIDDDGVLVLPDDLSDLTGRGTRRSTTADVTLRWGDTAPLGFSLTAGISELRYIGATSPSLVDTSRAYVGGNLRLRLSDVTEADMGLRHSTYKEQTPGAVRRDTVTLDAGLSHQLPRGRLTARLTGEDAPEGTRVGLSFGRSFDLPRGTVSASLGATRGVSGTTSLTGALNLRQDLPRGQITAALRRSVSAGSDDSEQTTTALSLGLQQELTQTLSLGFDLLHAISDPNPPTARVDNTSIGVSVNHMLTEDWDMSLGYRHRLRDQEGLGKARANTVFLTLRRDFVARY